MDFDEKFKLAPTWQKERYVRFVNLLGIELSDDEKKYLLWLAGWDRETESVLTTLFKRLKSSSLK